MKFLQQLQSNMVQEWQEAYIDYAFLKILLKPMGKLQKKNIQIPFDKDTNINITNLNQNSINQIETFTVIFKKVLDHEFNKFETFLELKIVDTFRLWRLIKLNTNIFNQVNQNGNYEKERTQLKHAYIVFLRQLHMLNEYYNLNFEGFRKIIKKFNKINKFISSEFTCEFQNLNFKNIYIKSTINEYKFKLEVIQKKVEENFQHTFYMQNSKKSGQMIQKIYKGSLISQKTTFQIGMLFGMAIFLSIIIFLLIYFNQTKLAQNQAVLSTIPIFRFNFLLFIYYVINCINIYIWTKSKINYCLILKHDKINSDFSQKLIRAANYLNFFLIFFLWFILIETDIDKISQFFNILPSTWLPTLLTLTNIYRLITVSHSSRKALIKIDIWCYYEILFQPSHKLKFYQWYMFQQLFSFTFFMKDFIYWITFLFQLESNNDTNLYSYAIIYFILLEIFRHQIESKIDYLVYSKFFFIIIWILFGKFLYISYFIGFLCDLIKWGFLRDQNLLRKDLFTKIIYYQLGIVYSFIFYYFYLIQIKTEMENFDNTQITLVAIAEFCRKGIWNRFVIEVVHINNIENHIAIDDFKLPFQKFDYEIDQEYLFSKEYEKILQTMKNKQKNQQLSNMNLFDNKEQDQLSIPLLEPTSKRMKDIFIEINDQNNIDNMHYSNQNNTKILQMMKEKLQSTKDLSFNKQALIKSVNTFTEVINNELQYNFFVNQTIDPNTTFLQSRKGINHYLVSMTRPIISNTLKTNTIYEDKNKKISNELINKKDSVTILPGNQESQNLNFNKKQKNIEMQIRNSIKKKTGGKAPNSNLNSGQQFPIPNLNSGQSINQSNLNLGQFNIPNLNSGQQQ